MKTSLFFITSLIGLSAFGQGLLNEVNWYLPNGGQLSGGTNSGYNAVSGTAFPSHNTGSQSWGLMDMNGDDMPDLVVTAQLQGGDVTCFSPGLNQYWNVYLNTGGQFNTNPLQWSLPNGGRINSGIIYGFDNFSGTALQSNNAGSQSWQLMDMDGDKKPDLVVTAQLQAGNVTCFSPGSGQYWKVYLNNGTGFSPAVVNWNLPNGGKISSGVSFGYNGGSGVAFSSDNTGSQSWSVNDIDGDGKVDLIVTAQLQAGNVTCFSPGSGQYWKVYSNTGTGFNMSASDWGLPNGGKLSGGTTFGYNSLSGTAFSSDNTGSQTWAFVDMNGDRKGDLVVAAQLQGGNVTCFSPGSGQYWKVFPNTGSAFDTNPVTWNLPDGGKLSGGVTYGYNSIAGMAQFSENTGSQSWVLMDTDGYGEPELVVTAQMQGGNVTCFSPGSGQYWKVYGNVGHSSFSGSPVNYMLPNGGKLSGGITYGYNSIGATALPSENTGSQSWVVMDMDGDKKPDMVVTAQLQGGFVTSFSPQSSQYWKVYKSDFVAGIKKNQYESYALEVFPNPSAGAFYLRANNEQDLRIYNELGQLILQSGLRQSNNYQVEITGLTPGVYFVSGKNTSCKVVVLK